MIGLISTPVTSLLPEASARATSQPPPGPMISVLAPGRIAYGKPGPCAQEIRCARRRSDGRKSKLAMPVEASASMTIVSAGIGSWRDGDAREAVPLDEDLPAAASGPWRSCTSMNVSCAVENDERDQGQSERDGDDASAPTTPASVNQMAAAAAKQHGRGDHRVRSAERFEQRNQDQASAGRAEQIEEVHAVDALDRVSESPARRSCRRRRNGSGAGEVDARQASGWSVSPSRIEGTRATRRRPARSPTASAPSLRKHASRARPTT